MQAVRRRIISAFVGEQSDLHRSELPTLRFEYSGRDIQRVRAR
jgi:hypothetical protein